MKKYQKLYETDRLPSGITITKYWDEMNRREGHIIPINKFFRFGKSYPKKLDDFIENWFTYGFNSKEKEWESHWKSLPNKIIPFDKIIPTQDNLDIKKVNGMPVSSDPAWFVKINTYYYLIDGHHRVASQIMANKQIKGKVVDLKKPGKTFPKF